MYSFFDYYIDEKYKYIEGIFIRLFEIKKFSNIKYCYECREIIIVIL